MYVILTFKNFTPQEQKIMGLGKKFLATLALTGALSGAANTSVELHKYSEQSALPIPQLQVGTVANAGFNWCPDTSRNITDTDGYYIDSRLNSCGLIYIRMNPKAANFLVQEIDQAIIWGGTVTGGAHLFKKLPRKMQTISGVALVNMFSTKSKVSFCASQGQNTMFRTYAWSGWLYMNAYCE
jgi:hypothetical protein